MRARLLVAAVTLLPLATAASAASLFESSKLSPGVVVQGTALQSSKLSPGIVVQGTALQSSKLSPGVVLQGTAFQSPKISIGIVLQTVASGGTIPRAPLTHW